MILMDRNVGVRQLGDTCSGDCRCGVILMGGHLGVMQLGDSYGGKCGCEAVG